MITRKTLWLALAAAVTTACSPVEYADELGRNKIMLDVPGSISGTYRLSMSLESEDKPVLVTEINTDQVDDFRGPPGWYIGEIAGVLGTSGTIDKIQAVFKYNEDSVTRANFGVLGTMTHALHKCGLRQYSVQQSIDILQSAFGIDPSIQEASEAVKSDMVAINEGFQEYANELGLSYYELMVAITKDISSDCMLNGYSQNISTGARDFIDYNGSTKTATELANGISAGINKAGLLRNQNVNQIVNSIQYNSSVLFDSNIDVYDVDPAILTPITDLSVSMFSTTTLSFSYTDVVGLDYLTASIAGEDLAVSYDKLNNRFQLTFDTTKVINDTHLLLITSYDVVGNIGTHQYPVIIDNLGPSVANTRQHYNTRVAPLRLLVTPPTGLVSKVSINGVQFSKTGENSWEGNVSLHENVNEFTVNASTNFGLDVQRSITVFYDDVAPQISAKSLEYPVATATGLDAGVSNLADIQTSTSFFDLRTIPHYDFGFRLSESEMAELGMLFLDVNAWDGYEGDNDSGSQPEAFSSPVERIQLQVELSINGVGVKEKQFGFGQAILPITYDFFGDHLSNITASDIVELNLRAADLAGNATVRSYALPIYNESMTHTLNAGYDLQGSFTPMVYKDGLTSNLAPIVDDEWNSSLSIDLSILYNQIAIDLSNVSYYNTERGLYTQAYPGTTTMDINMGTFDRTIMVDHGLSLYAAYLKADNQMNSTEMNDSILFGDAAFSNDFEGLLTETPYDSISQITEYSAKANATIIREAFIRASNQYESTSKYQCSAFDIEKLAAYDYADDFVANKSSNPIVNYCNEFSPYDAARLIANQEREIVNELGLLEKGNEFDLKVARPHYSPVGPIAISAFDVDSYSENLTFTPVYRSETNTYNIEMYLNNEYQASYKPGEEIVIDTTAYPNGMYVVKLIMTDLYFNTTTDTFFSTFNN